MKYYIATETKRGLELLMANLKLTNGEKWTDDITKAFHFFDEQTAKERLKFNQKIVNEEYANKIMTKNLSLKMSNLF